MKNNPLVLLIAMAFGILSLPVQATHPSEYSAELVSKIQQDYLYTVQNDDLTQHLESNFTELFDEVKVVTAHFDAANEVYYYTVAGEKDGTATIERLKVYENDIQNETYTYLNFENIRSHFGEAAVRYCVTLDVFPNAPSYCPSGCNLPVVCPGMVCGVYENGNCVENIGD